MSASNIIVVEVTNPETGERIKKVRATFDHIKDEHGQPLYPNGLNIFTSDENLKDWQAMLAHIKSVGKKVLNQIRIATHAEHGKFCFISDTVVEDTIF